MSVLKITPYTQVKIYLKNVIRIRPALVALLLATGLIVLAQTPSPREYQVKAVFIFNFTQFVEWPASSFTADQDPFVIGILGESPFGSYLEETVSGEKVNGHPLLVQYYKNSEDIGACHILFINLPSKSKKEDVAGSLKGKNILTVSDAPGFLQEGGAIRFFTKDSKIQLQINPEAVKTSNLVISSKLLRLADIFTPDKKN